MPRFPAYRSPYDDTPLTDGDSAFRGFSSRIQPTALEAGMLSISENLRLEHAVAQTRKGALALCADVRVNRPPLILDFDLEPDIPGLSIACDPATGISTVTLAAPITLKPDHDRIAFESPTLPAAYNGSFDILSLSLDSTTLTFRPNDTPTAPPALFTGPFSANAGPILSAIESDTVRGSCVATDTKNREMVIMALIDRAIIYRPGLPDATIAYPVNQVLGVTQEVTLVQFVDKVYLFCGLSPTATADTDTLPEITPASDVTMVWDMDFTHPFAFVPQGPHPAATDDGTGNPSLIRQPPANWGVAFNRQLILPRGRDELIISDFLDADTYDNLNSELRIMPGGNDWLVGVFPYQMVKGIIFYRKSIHIAAFASDTGTVESVYEITRQFGCAARNTIAGCGAQILWLSDSGVYALNIGYEMNLTAATAPLSEPVQDIIARVNWPQVHRAAATYYNNRYYLALPLDGSPHNNAILIYNFLNQAWETIDLYPPEFDVQAFATLDYNGQHRLHAVTTYGYVFLLEENDAGMDDDTFATPGVIKPGGVRNPKPATAAQARARLVTRGITFGTIEPKRFTQLQIESDMAAGETITVANITRNPDTDRGLLTFTAAKTTDYTHRLHLRARGVATQVQVTTTAGRPQIKGLFMEAASFNNQDTMRK